MVAWDEQTRSGRRIALGRATAKGSGNLQFVRQPIDDSESGVYPAVTLVNDAFVIAWTSGPAGQTKLRTERLEP